MKWLASLLCRLCYPPKSATQHISAGGGESHETKGGAVELVGLSHPETSRMD